MRITKTPSLFPDTRPEAEAVLIGLLRQAPLGASYKWWTN